MGVTSFQMRSQVYCILSLQNKMEYLYALELTMFDSLFNFYYKHIDLQERCFWIWFDDSFWILPAL